MTTTTTKTARKPAAKILVSCRPWLRPRHRHQLPGDRFVESLKERRYTQ
jgi:hypothetical protein